jgi:hypothetical protein
LELAVLSPVALERAAGGVEGPTVELDDELLLAPEEVWLPAAYACVRLGLREAGLADEVEHQALGFGAGELGLRSHRLLQCRPSSVVGVTTELLIEGKV